MVKDYIKVDKYKKQILGKTIYIYNIHFNEPIKCNPITIKNYFKSRVKTHFKKTLKSVLKYLMKDKISTQIYKKDKKFMTELLKLFNPAEKYTYCLNKNNLIIVETKTINNKSIIKDLLSKHVLLCDKGACASGEMVIYKNKFIFDNSSGTYKPSIENLQHLKKLSFLNLKIIDLNDKNHLKYFNP